MNQRFLQNRSVAQVSQFSHDEDENDDIAGNKKLGNQISLPPSDLDDVIMSVYDANTT